jgi:hypothetical protein
LTAVVDGINGIAFTLKAEFGALMSIGVVGGFDIRIGVEEGSCTISGFRTMTGSASCSSSSSSSSSSSTGVVVSEGEGVKGGAWTFKGVEESSTCSSTLEGGLLIRIAVETRRLYNGGCCKEGLLTGESGVKDTALTLKAVVFFDSSVVMVVFGGSDGIKGFTLAFKGLDVADEGAGSVVSRGDLMVILVLWGGCIKCGYVLLFVGFGCTGDLNNGTFMGGGV